MDPRAFYVLFAGIAVLLSVLVYEVAELLSRALERVP